jgi:hypothetical protein
VISANSFLRGKTVADLKAWAEKKMGGNGGVVPTYSPAVAAAVNGMPDNLAAQVREASHNDVSEWAGQQNAGIKAQRLQTESDFRLRIANGDASLTSAEILNNTTLDNGEKATLLNTFNEKMKTVQQTQSDLAAFEAGKLTINPYAEKDHKRVDDLWTAQTKNLQAGTDTKPILDGIVQQTGMIPAAVSGALRTALTSQNPQTVAQAATAALRLRSLDHYVFQRRGGGSEIEDKAVLFDQLANKAGEGSLAAAIKLSALNDPTKKADRDALLKSKDTEDWLKATATESNARAVFSPGFFSFTPKLGDTPAQAAAATAEYRDMLSEALVDAHGDKSLALTLAGERFKRRYAPSKYAFTTAFEARDNAVAPKGQTFANSAAVVRLPPEVTYPAGVDGTHDYIGSQAKEALAKEGVTADAVYLMPNATTEADVTAGRPARYDLYYKHGDVIERAQHPFYADPPTRAEALEAKKRKAMASRDVNRAAAEVNAELAGTAFDPNLTFPR